MDVSLSNILTGGAILVGVVGGYVTLRWRVGQLEKTDAAKVAQEALELAKAADAKIEAVRTDQGRRLGRLGKEVDQLAGFIRGYQQARPSQNTKADGLPISSPRDDGDLR